MILTKTYLTLTDYFLQIVLPSKTIGNQAILDTLTKQANSGIYRLRDSTLQDFHDRVRRLQTPAVEWKSFDNGNSDP